MQFASGHGIFVLLVLLVALTAAAAGSQWLENSGVWTASYTTLLGILALQCFLVWMALQVVAWPVGIMTLVRVLRGEENAILDMASEGMRLGEREAFVIRDYLFFGTRTVFVQTERFVKAVLQSERQFTRMKVPDDRITSPHTILGAGGMSSTWQRIRGICGKFFQEEHFRVHSSGLVEHVKAAVDSRGGECEDFFQLCNRLIVDAHMIVLLGMEAVPPAGFQVTSEEGPTSMADTIDEALTFKFGADSPTYTSDVFRPIVSMLLDRFSLAPDDSKGLEAILVQAHKAGKIDSTERLHNIIMFLIALAPSPTVFWTLSHLYQDVQQLQKARNNVQYLVACIKETLRMYAPVPMMFPRLVNEELTLGDIHLSKGDRVVIPTILIQNDSRLWEKPGKYDPDRFYDYHDPDDVQPGTKDALDSLPSSPSGFRIAPGSFSDVVKAARLSPKSGNSPPKLWARLKFKAEAVGRVVAESKQAVGIHRVSDWRDAKYDDRVDPKRASKARYFPFGMATNTCLGQHYVTHISQLVIGTIVANYDVKIDDPEGLFDLPQSYQRIKTHVYSFPKHKVRATIKPRQD